MFYYPCIKSGLLAETTKNYLIFKLLYRAPGLDSYQDRDSKYLADQWLKCLNRRKVHLTREIDAITKKEGF